MYNGLGIIKTLELFPRINNALIELLEGLSYNEWEKETVLPGRTVKDLAAHILDSSLRRLSCCRDNFNAETPVINEYSDLVNYIQKLNSTWIEVARRFSPRILIELLKHSEEWLYEYFKSIDLLAESIFPVAWAGETKSANWFDIAREYTEKWHHQMQIRLAVGKPILDSEELLSPVIATFMRGLPYAYRDVDAAPDTVVMVKITGIGGGIWYLHRRGQKWLLVIKTAIVPKTTIEFPVDTAWQLFTDSINEEEAARCLSVTGDSCLAKYILKMSAVMR